MSRAISLLSAAMGKGLQWGVGLEGNRGMAGLPHLEQANVALAARFDRVDVPLPPPLKKRLEAVRKFREDEEVLNKLEWRLVFSGLADIDGEIPALLDDNPMFSRVRQHVDLCIESRELTRKDWLGLCASYFVYHNNDPEKNNNWCQLRDTIDRGFEAVKQRLGKERAWMQVVQEYRDLFGGEPSSKLAEALFTGRLRDLSPLQAIAQIPDKSWLWRQVFNIFLSRIFLLDDDSFRLRLPELVGLGQLKELYKNEVLKACLTRYHASSFRDQSSALLKQAALDSWGSPQMRSRQNAWLQYVSEPVCAMVVAWFAKDDLEHFFTLLKGEAEVDQSRLFYWLRFANQMSYTRIVMGLDASRDSSTDFVDFRQKNNGRLSRLVGAQRHVSAVIMQINDYLFVEYSGTGHACYVFKAGQTPFEPSSEEIDLKDVRQASKAFDTMSHSQRPSAPNIVSGWLVRFDEKLRELGIMLDGGYKYAANTFDKSEDWNAQLKLHLPDIAYKVQDNRAVGGALKVELGLDDPRSTMTLLRLGFKPTNGNSRLFWRP